MSLRFTPGSRYRTNAAKSPLLLDENVTPYWMRSFMLASARRMTSRTRRIAPSDGGSVLSNHRSTAADFGTRRSYVDSHCDDDLRASLTAPDVPNGVRGLAQRVRPIDRRAHLAGLDE